MQHGFLDYPLVWDYLCDKNNQLIDVRNSEQDIAIAEITAYAGTTDHESCLASG